jgi:FAD/FMN-containing dehydrogenase
VDILAVEVAMTSAIETLDVLRRRVRGRIVEPSEPGFDELRRTFNAMLDRRPRVIVRPVDTVDVAAAVAWATDVDLPISIRGGGHSVAGHAVGQDALMIDLGELRDVTVDRRGRTAEAGGGALLEDLDRATTAVGLAAPSGTYLDTGVAGLTLTGGIGYLLGSAGFACDALVGAEVVTADGTIVQVDGDSDPELLWALRGGGGNFGVVTKLRHALMPLGAVYGGQIRFAGPAVPEVVRLLFALQGPDAPDELTIQGTVGLDAERGPIASVFAAWVGAPEEGPRRLAPITALPGAFVHDIGPTTYLALQTMFERMGPTYRHYWKGQFVADVSAGLQATILDRAADAPADSAILIEPIHGLAHRFPDGHAAFGSRRALANVSALGIWSAAADDARAIGWARTTTAALEPFSLRGGGYLNYAPEDETASRVEQAFGGESFPRLQAVKRRIDPDNRFRFNANIPPA